MRLFILGLLFSTQFSLAQVVTGSIVDNTSGEPILFAHVHCDSLGTGTVRTDRGKFILK